MKAMGLRKRGNPAAYALAILPFIVFFLYQLLFLKAHRPDHADVAHGYTFQIGIGDDGSIVRYISPLDCLMTFGPFVCGTMIMLIGAWRGGAFSRKKGGNYK
jgi:hypothetical protein